MAPWTSAYGKHEAVTGEARVRDVVREVVAQAAPEELPVVDGLAAFDDVAVVRRLRRRGRRREPLGFGLGEVAVLVTAIVWLVVDEAAKCAAGAVVDGTAKRLRGVLRKVFRRRAEPVVVPPLTRDQFADVQQRVLEAAAAAGLSEKRAKAIADAVVASLALNSKREGSPKPPDGGPTEG